MSWNKYPNKLNELNAVKFRSTCFICKFNFTMCVGFLGPGLPVIKLENSFLT